MKLCLENNDIEMYSTYNKIKFVDAERFIRTLRNKIYKCMASVVKNLYIDKLDNMINKCNNTYLSTAKMKLADVNSNTYTDFGIENNDKDPKFKTGDRVRISKYKTIFAKFYFCNWLEEAFVIKMLKVLFLGFMLLVVLTVKKLL